jgi:hypothetical protein
MRVSLVVVTRWNRRAVTLTGMAIMVGLLASGAALAADTPVVAATADKPAASASTPAKAPGTAAQAWPDSARTIEFGFEERVRNERFDNLTDHSDAKNDERSQYRFRTRMWVKVPINGHFELYAGVANESRKYAVPNTPFTNDETFIETFYVGTTISTSSSLRLGRQNIMRGDGFILMEGNPLDGSRSIYFNALTYLQSFNKGKTSFELIAAADPNREQYLPVNHALNKGLVEWDETIVGAYVTDKRLAKTELQAYYFHKKELNDYRVSTNAQYQPDKRFETLGGRVVHKLPGNWVATGEFAGQWGSLETGPSTRGWGGQGYLRKTFKHAWKPSVSVGYIGLSGDDPSTSTQEGWSPVAGRWPKWSELYIYSQVPERGVAYWTNVSMYQVEATAAPSKYVSLRGTYYHMDALHRFAGSTAIFGAGTNRGNMYQARADITITPTLKGHLIYESLTPGSFYAGRDRGYFLRWDVSYAFSRKVKLPSAR